MSEEGGIDSSRNESVDVLCKVPVVLKERRKKRRDEESQMALGSKEKEGERNDSPWCRCFPQQQKERRSKVRGKEGAVSFLRCGGGNEHPQNRTHHLSLSLLPENPPRSTKEHLERLPFERSDGSRGKSLCLSSQGDLSDVGISLDQDGSVVANEGEVELLGDGDDGLGVEVEDDLG